MGSFHCNDDLDQSVEQVYVKFEAAGEAQGFDVDERVKIQADRLNKLRREPSVKWALPLFTRPPRDLLRELQDLDPDGAKGLSDLTTWFRIRAEKADAAKALEVR